MGKPYIQDIAEFPATFAWAQHTNIDSLVSALAEMGTFPLYAVGSGGAYSTAVLAAQLHQVFCGHIARPLTPLAAAQVQLRKASALIISASGRNPDVIGSFKRMVDLEPAALTVLCLRKGSPLSRIARQHTHVHLIEEELPSGKDGFVATNSIIAFALLLWRAYSLAFTTNWAEAGELDAILGTAESIQNHIQKVDVLFEPLRGKQHFIVLFSPIVEAAAIDLESKFSEAALGSVQLADYRNFAHGRHHWIAKRGTSTGVLAFMTDHDQSLADRTLKLLPRTTAVARFYIPGAGLEVAISALVIAQLIALAAGKAIGIDPGRPGVPEFGRKLYNLKTWTYLPLARSTVAIERKRSAAPLSATHDVTDWPTELERFLSGLKAAKFRGVVFDYDGTLCDEDRRWKDMPHEVAPFICQAIKNGIRIGIATGRGGSVRNAIRNSIPKNLWPKILMGYYNCAQIGRLDDDSLPIRTEAPAKSLERVAAILSESRQLNACAKIEIRDVQIVISPKLNGYAQSVRELVAQLIASEFQKGVICVHSTHSVDVIVSQVNKLNILPYLCKAGLEVKDMLRVGDLGRWPGNDFALLDSEFGLSTNQVSAKPGGCWNLVPAGLVNFQATLYYLRSFEIRKGYIRVNTRRLMGD